MNSKIFSKRYRRNVIPSWIAFVEMQGASLMAVFDKITGEQISKNRIIVFADAKNGYYVYLTKPNGQYILERREISLKYETENGFLDIYP